MQGLKKAFLWLKNHWYIPVILLVILLALGSGYAFRRKMFDLINKGRESYKKEIDQLNKANQEKEEAKKLAELEKEEKLKKSKEKYKQELVKLDEEKKKEVEEYIDKYKGSPDKLAKKLAKKFGLDYVE